MEALRVRFDERLGGGPGGRLVAAPTERLDHEALALLPPLPGGELTAYLVEQLERAPWVTAVELLASLPHEGRLLGVSPRHLVAQRPGGIAIGGLRHLGSAAGRGRRRGVLRRA